LREYFNPVSELVESCELKLAELSVLNIARPDLQIRMP